MSLNQTTGKHTGRARDVGLSVDAGDASLSGHRNEPAGLAFARTTRSGRTGAETLGTICVGIDVSLAALSRISAGECTARALVVVAVLESGEQSVVHAMHCFELTQQLRLRGFDLAYAHEALARAQAAAGDPVAAARHYEDALQAADEISGPQDRKLFLDDLKSPPWFGAEI